MVLTKISILLLLVLSTAFKSESKVIIDEGGDAQNQNANDDSCLCVNLEDIKPPDINENILPIESRSFYREKFDQWFLSQIKNLNQPKTQKQGNINMDGIEKSALEQFLLQILQNNGMRVRNDAQLTDSFGKVSNIQSLNLKPTLAGSRTLKTLVQKNGETLSSQSQLPYTQMLLVTSKDPFKLLGINAFGNTQLPLSTAGGSELKTNLPFGSLTKYVNAKYFDQITDANKFKFLPVAHRHYDTPKTVVDYKSNYVRYPYTLTNNNNFDDLSASVEEDRNSLLYNENHKHDIRINPEVQQDTIYSKLGKSKGKLLKKNNQKSNKRKDKKPKIKDDQSSDKLPEVLSSIININGNQNSLGRSSLRYMLNELSSKAFDFLDSPFLDTDTPGNIGHEKSDGAESLLIQSLEIPGKQLNNLYNNGHGPVDVSADDASDSAKVLIPTLIFPRQHLHLPRTVPRSGDTLGMDDEFSRPNIPKLISDLLDKTRNISTDIFFRSDSDSASKFNPNLLNVPFRDGSSRFDSDVFPKNYDSERKYQKHVKTMPVSTFTGNYDDLFGSVGFDALVNKFKTVPASKLPEIKVIPLKKQMPPRAGVPFPSYYTRLNDPSLKVLSKMFDLSSGDESTAFDAPNPVYGFSDEDILSSRSGALPEGNIDIDADQVADLLIDNDDDDSGDFRIIGGNAATGSGTPLSNKGRSGFVL